MDEQSVTPLFRGVRGRYEKNWRSDAPRKMDWGNKWNRGGRHTLVKYFVTFTLPHCAVHFTFVSSMVCVFIAHQICFEKEKIVSFLICHFILQISLSLDTSFGHTSCCNLISENDFILWNSFWNLILIFKREKLNSLEVELVGKILRVGPLVG